MRDGSGGGPSGSPSNGGGGGNVGPGGRGPGGYGRGNKGNSGNSGNNGGCCFIAGTKVIRSDGSYDLIENIKIGDELLGEDGEKNSVIKLEQPPLAGRKLYRINDSVPFVTSEHPFRVDDKWKSIEPEITNTEHAGLDAEQLELGDKITRIGNGPLEVDAIVGYGADEQTVYNFQLGGNNTYFADDFLVHNKMDNGDPNNPTPYVPPWKNPYGSEGFEYTPYASTNDSVNQFLTNTYNVEGAYEGMINAANKINFDASKKLFDDGISNRKVVGGRLDSQLGDLSAYNDKVNAFNTNIGSYTDQLRGTYDQLDGIDLNGFEDFQYDGPNYKDISTVFQSKAPEIKGVIKDAFGNDVDLSSFDSGAVDLTDSGEMRDLYGLVQGQRDTNQNLYDAELFRNDAFSREFDSGLTSYDRNFGRADIYGNGVLDDFSDNAYNMRDNLNRYSSDLDSFGDTLTGYGESLDGIDTQLGTSQGLYDTEKTALEDFYKGMDTDYLDRAIEFDDIGIADGDQIESFDTGINSLVQTLRGFDNKINDDSQQNDYLRRFSGLDDQVDGLRDDRNNELDRVDDYRRMFKSDLNGIQSGLDGTGIYDGNAMSRFDGRLSDLTNNVEGFRSELTPDFASILSNIGLSRDQLTGLQDQRTSGIGDIQSELESLLASGQGMELYDEDGINETIDGMNAQGTALSRYSGNGLDDVQNYLTTSSDAMGGRLDDLSDYRGGIETRSQEYLDQLGDMQFYNQESVDSAYDPYNELNTEQELYGATQARDEIAGIQNYLQGQTDRISSSAESVAARNAAEAQNVGDMGVNNDYINRLFSSGDLSPEEFALLISKVGEKDKVLAQQYQNQYGAQYA